MIYSSLSFYLLLQLELCYHSHTQTDKDRFTFACYRYLQFSRKQKKQWISFYYNHSTYSIYLQRHMSSRISIFTGYYLKEEEDLPKWFNSFFFPFQSHIRLVLSNCNQFVVYIDYAQTMYIDVDVHLYKMLTLRNSFSGSTYRRRIL